MAPRTQPTHGFNDTDPMMPPPSGFPDAAPDSSGRASGPKRPGRAEEGGEGNREADRAYRDGVAETLATKDVGALADEAKRALDGPEADDLREAEKRGKAGKPAARGAKPVFPKKQRH